MVTDMGDDGMQAAYAAWRESTLGRITDALERDLLLERIGRPSGLRVLEVGCGDGDLAIELASRDAHVTGVDRSERMIAAARERAAAKGDTRFQVASAEALPFDNDAFDVVLAVTVLCFVADATAAMNEMTRILKPGGRLIIGELGRYSSWAALRRLKGWFGSSIWSVARFRTPAELTRLANAAGLAEVSVTGGVFYPPLGLAARLLGPIDRKIGAWTTLGAAFLALSARKPHHPTQRGRPSWSPTTTTRRRS